MAKTKAKSTTKSAPWWLSGGEELCVHCGQLYAYEIEFRCPDCDGPSCPRCRVTVAERFVCPVCVADDQPGGSHG